MTLKQENAKGVFLFCLLSADDPIVGEEKLPYPMI